MASLEKRGVLARVNIGKRNRAWEAKEVSGILNDFERELAAPFGEENRTRRIPDAPMIVRLTLPAGRTWG